MGISLKNELYESFTDSELDAIETVANVAAEAGVNIYLVGGIARDLIMHNPIKDIDFIVEGDAIGFAEQLSQCAEAEIIGVQENLRTAKVLFKDNIEVDFASTREERYVASGVLPVAYNFGCPLENDVKRRDFTINTIYVSLSCENKYEIIDFYGGCNDIAEKKIKILHDKSFEDDPSRIIRALKFKKRFDFDFEEHTNDLMQKYLENPSSDMPLERIKGELKQYFVIDKTKLYEEIVSSNAYKLVGDNPVMSFDVETAEKTPEENRFFVYFLLLTLNSAYDKTRLNLTSFEKKTTEEVKKLLKTEFENASKKEIYDAFISCSDETINLYKIIKNDNAVNLFLNELKDIKAEITGNDLIKKGFKPSRLFGEIFDKIIEAKINGCIKTKEDELMFAEKYISD